MSECQKRGLPTAGSKVEMIRRLQSHSEGIRILPSTENNGKNDSRREPDIAVPNGLLYFHYQDALLGRNKSTYTKDNSIFPLSKQVGLSDWLHEDDNFAKFSFLTKPSDRSPSEDEEARKLWCETARDFLQRWFPRGSRRRYCIRKMGEIPMAGGKKGKDRIYWLFRDPLESDLHSKGWHPVAVLKEYAIGSETFLRIFRFGRVLNPKVLDSDLIIDSRIDIQPPKGRRYVEADETLLEKMRNQESKYTELSRKLSDWNEYLVWRANFESDEEWGGKIVSIVRPDPSNQYFSVTISVSDESWKKLQSSSKTKARLIAADPSLSQNNNEWERKEDEDIFSTNRKMTEAGKLFKNPKIKRGKDANGLNEVEIKIEPPNKEDFEIGLDPDKHIGHFLISDITLNLVDNRRQREAIRRVIELHSSGHNQIHEWLFDIGAARTKESPMLELPHETRFDLNELQEKAVIKAINCEDVCLIQGPPGTGKTTVIAEIINQVTNSGGSVLLSSQSNDAVDNALARLGGTPNVRPIRRLGSLKKPDPETEKFLVHNVVREFYIPSLIEKNVDSIENSKRTMKIREYPDYSRDLRKIKLEWDQQKKNSQTNRYDLAVAESSIQSLRESKEKTQADIDSVKLAKSWLDSGNFLKITNLMVGLIGPIKKQLEELAKLQSLVSESDYLEEILQTLSLVDDISSNEEYIDWSRDLSYIGNEGGFSDSIKSLLSPSIPENLTSEASEIRDNLDELKSEVLIKIGEIPRGDLIAEIEQMIQEALSALQKNMKKHNAGLSSKQESINEISANEAESRRRYEDAESRWREVADSITHLQIPKISEVELPRLENEINQLHRHFSDSFLEEEAWAGVTDELLEKLRDANKSGQNIRDIQSEYNSIVNVEGVTNSISGSPAFLRMYDAKPFDIVIIDEISKSTPTELLMPSLLGRRVVLVGDYNQLPPMFKSPGKQSDEISAQEIIDQEKNATRFRKLVTNSLFADLYHSADDSIKQSLTIQYRMHTEIMNCVNEFYEGNDRLISGFSELEEAQLKQHLFTITKKTKGGTHLSEGSNLLTHDRHVVWVDSTFNNHGTYCPEFRGKGGTTSRRNEREIELSLRILDDFNTQIGKMKKKVEEEKWSSDRMLRHLVSDKLPVAFITFYSDQVKAFREIVSGSRSWSAVEERWPHLAIKIQNVDRFQGSERPVVICSMVLSPKPPDNMAPDFKKAIGKIANNPSKIIEAGEDWKKGGIPAPNHPGLENPTNFASRPERINVALSRAQNLLVIVGNRFTFQKVKVRNKSSGNSTQIYSNIQNHIGTGGMIDGRDIL